MTRLKPIAAESLDDVQRALHDDIVGGARGAGRARSAFYDECGGLRGPFNAWLHRPDIGTHAARLGEQLRFAGRLSGQARELAVLQVAVPAGERPPFET